MDFFYFSRLLSLLGLSFEELEPKIFCLKSSLVTTLAQCKVAATFLGLPFKKSVYSTQANQLGGCQSYEGGVYLNSALHVGASNTVLKGIRAICINGGSIKHIIINNNWENLIPNTYHS